MSNFYQELCEAIIQKNEKKYSEIAEQLNNNLFSDDVYQLCMDVQNNLSSFTKLLQKSTLEPQTQIDLLKWFDMALSFHKMKSEFKLSYLAPLKRIINSKQSLKEKNDRILKINPKLNNEALIYLAMTESYEILNTKGPKIKYFFYLNLLNLIYALNFISTKEPNTLRLIQSLTLLKQDGFTPEELAKILIVQPVRSLFFVHQFYVNMREIIDREQVLKLCFGMQWADWPKVIAPLDLLQKHSLVRELVKNLVKNLREESCELYSIDESNISLNSTRPQTLSPAKKPNAGVLTEHSSAPTPPTNLSYIQSNQKNFSVKELLNDGQASPSPTNFFGFFSSIGDLSPAPETFNPNHYHN